MSSKSRHLVAIARWGKVFDLNWHDLSKHTTSYNKNRQHDFTAGQVGFYLAGFPCTPYSLLHWGSMLLGEEAAKPMWQCIRNFKRSQPAVTCQVFDGMSQYVTVAKCNCMLSLIDLFGFHFPSLGSLRMSPGSIASWTRSFLFSQVTFLSVLLYH